MIEGSKQPLSVSVIIPTYNRSASLLCTLESLAQQTLPADRFEVVVVDDGGCGGTDRVVQLTYPFTIAYFHQANQGSAAARNRGAELSRGEILVFIDDDITLHPQYLSAIVQTTSAGCVCMGVWQPDEPTEPSQFSRVVARSTKAQAARAVQDEEVPYTECTSNNLAVRRADFHAVGMWRDVLGDGPTLWGDVEFGYRAWKMGCRFVRVADARLIHRDQHMTDLASATRRAHHVSRVAQGLFALHPEIKGHLPMFRDKSPIDWLRDPLELIARKLARQTVSSASVQHGMEKLIHALEACHPSPPILERLYRWVMSAHTYKGYRQGLEGLDAERSCSVPGLCSGLDSLAGGQGVKGGEEDAETAQEGDKERRLNGDP